METEIKNGLNVSTQTEKLEMKKTTHVIDIVLWALWAVLMWGFLITLSVVTSPADRPGIHEILITGYFLGFSVVFAIIYILVLKRG